MAEPFLGEIRLWACNYAPRGWALCNGQLLSINTNQALFSLLGTYYGGNGTTTFALPDLRGRTPVHVGNGVALGQSAGEESHTLTAAEIPMHTHQVSGTSGQVSVANAEGAIWGASPDNPYSAAAPNTQMNLASMGTAGNSQPHTNMQPYLTLNYCIATEGIYPTRN